MPDEHTHTFSYDIGQKVVVDGTNIKGVVAGLWVNKHRSQDIYVEYADDNNVLQGDYFTSKQLSLI